MADDICIFLEMCKIIEADVQKLDIICKKITGIRGIRKVIKRPLLSTLNYEITKYKFHLSYDEWKHDKSKEKCKQAKALRDNTKELQDKDKSGDFLYLVRGMHGRSILKKTKLINTQAE